MFDYDETTRPTTPCETPIPTAAADPNDIGTELLNEVKALDIERDGVQATFDLTQKCLAKYRDNLGTANLPEVKAVINEVIEKNTYMWNAALKETGAAYMRDDNGKGFRTHVFGFILTDTKAIVDVIKMMVASHIAR